MFCRQVSFLNVLRSNCFLLSFYLKFSTPNFFLWNVRGKFGISLKIEFSFLPKKKSGQIFWDGRKRKGGQIFWDGGSIILFKIVLLSEKYLIQLILMQCVFFSVGVSFFNF